MVGKKQETKEGEIIAFLKTPSDKRNADLQSQIDAIKLRFCQAYADDIQKCKKPKKQPETLPNEGGQNKKKIAEIVR